MMNGEIVRGILVLGVLIFIGRLFCGKICPFGFLQDLIHKIPFPVKIKTFKFDRYLRYIKYLVLLSTVIGIIYGSGGSHERSDASTIPMIPIIVVVIIIFTIFERPFCKYICHFGTIASIGNKLSFYKYGIKKGQCIKCGVCSKVCKMNVKPEQEPNSLECIRCGQCKKACPRNAIVSGFTFRRKFYE
jgi:polyferredoxin